MPYLGLVSVLGFPILHRGYVLRNLIFTIIAKDGLKQHFFPFIRNAKNQQANLTVYFFSLSYLLDICFRVMFQHKIIVFFYSP